MKMTCKSCGKEIADKCKFCPECGAAQERNVRKSCCIKPSQKEESAVLPHQKRKSLLHYIAVCVVSISSFILFFTPNAPYKFTLFLTVVVGLLYLCAEKSKQDIKVSPNMPSCAKANRPIYKNIIQKEPTEINTEEELQAFCEEHPLIDDFFTKVKGVTFCNEDGSSRQEILSYCCAGERIGFRRYLYNGKPAFAIVTDHGEIGNLPADIAENIDSAYGPEAYLSGTISDITGGDGGLYYGCNLHLYVYGPSKPFG